MELKNILSTTKLAIIFLALLLLIVLNYYVWIKDHKQEKKIVILQKELVYQEAENQNISTSNSKLKKRVESLKLGGGEMIEEEARNGFGMVGDGETFFYVETPEEAN